MSGIAAAGSIMIKCLVSSGGVEGAGSGKKCPHAESRIRCTGNGYRIGVVRSIVLGKCRIGKKEQARDYSQESPGAVLRWDNIIVTHLEYF